MIRLMTADDLPAVRAIYDHYVATSTCTFQVEPDTEDERRAWFDGRGPAHPATVAVDGEVGHKFGRWLDVAYLQLIL